MNSATKILRPSKLKTIAFLIVSLALTVGGFFMIEEKGFMGWITFICFGLASIVFLLQFIPNSTYLKLTHDGFEVRSLFRSHFTPWDQILQFKAGYLGPNKGVVYDYSFKHQKQATGKKISKLLAGNEGGLPETYGMSAKDLAALMNEWKAKSKPAKTNS